MPTRMIFASAQAPRRIEAAAPEAQVNTPPALPVFDVLAYTGGAINVQAYWYPVVIDLTGVEVADKLRVLHAHRAEQPIGYGYDVAIGETDITLKVTLTGEDQITRMVVAHAKNQFPWATSVGAEVITSEFLEDGQKAIVNQQEFTGPMVIARKSKLRELSFLALGADENSAATLIAAAAKTEATSVGTDAGTSPPGASGTAIVEAQASATTTAQPPEGAPMNKPVTLTAEMAARRQEDAWRLELQAVCSEHPMIHAQAIREGMTIEAARLAVEKASAPQRVPSSKATSGIDINAAILECAMLQAARVDEKFIAASASDEIQQKAHTAFRGAVGLQRVLIAAARMGGYSEPIDGRVSMSQIKPLIQAAFSNVDARGIFSNASNKMLLAGFMGVEQAWRMIARISSTNDFKTKEYYRLTSAATFEVVGPDGEIKQATIGEERFTNRVRPYAKGLSITREDIINDDLGALSEAAQQLGRGGGLALNQVFWKKFIDRMPTFATTGKGNRLTGAGSALSIAALSAAEDVFLSQKDAEGNPLGFTAGFLVHPTPLGTIAKQLYKEEKIGDNTANKVFLAGNPHVGSFEPVRTAYLKADSATRWYLTARPEEVPVIDVCFLENRQVPVVETAEADFDQLGMKMRGYFDFGIELQDDRAIVANDGA